MLYKCQFAHAQLASLQAAREKGRPKLGILDSCLSGRRWSNRLIIPCITKIVSVSIKNVHLEIALAGPAAQSALWMNNVCHDRKQSFGY